MRGASAVVRQAARAFIEALGLRAIGPEHADTVVLVVSELVTNALRLRHGGGTCTLRLAAYPHTIEVAVEDLSPHPPRMRTRVLDGATGGFGLHMVNDLARATVVTPKPEAENPYAPSFPAGPAGRRGLRAGSRRSGSLRTPSWRPTSPPTGTRSTASSTATSPLSLAFNG
ncbi:MULTISPECIES: ATP-binding protein [Streptomyces]|uniref:ATP-binding protein n=1 Tax=Streptomyces TaxID=1883 RepID=UPI000B0595BC|nr:ATP-binding protein [Streptomyces sp. IGB124]